jgi:TP901 family phage tail tape measure protein
MNQVEAVTKNGSAQFEELSEKAQEMGLTTRYSAVQAAEGMSFLGKAGLDANTVLKAIPTTLNLAASASLDLASAADIVTNVMQGFQMSTEELAGASDVLALAFTSSNTDLVQLGDAFKYAGPVAKAMNLSFEETVAVLGTLSNAGIQASMAGTTLRGALTRLAGPSKAGAKALGKYSIAVADSQGAMLPFRDILTQFEAGLESSSSELEFMADLIEIFGQRAGPGMAALIGVGSEAIAEFTGELEKAEGTTERIKNIQLKGLAGAMITLKSAMEGASLSIGQALAPVVIKIAGYLREAAIMVANLAKWFKTLPQPIQSFTIGLVAAAAALGPMMFLFGAFLNQIAGLSLLGPTLLKAGGYFVKFGKHFKSMGGVLKAVNIGKVFKAINKATVSFGKTFIGTMKGIPGALKAVPGAIKGVGASILSTVKGLGPALVSGGAAIKGAIMGIVSSLGGIVSSLMAPGGMAAAFVAVKGALLSFGAAILAIGWPIAVIAAAVIALGAAAYVMYKHWEDVKAVMIGLWTDLSNFIRKAAGKIWKWIEGAIGGEAASWIKKIWTGISNFLKKAWGKILDVFQNGLKTIVKYAALAAHALGMENTAKALDTWHDKLTSAREEVEDLADSTEDLSRELDDQNDALDDNAEGWEMSEEAMEAYLKQLEVVNKAIEDGDKILKSIPDSIQDILNATRQSGLPKEWQDIDKAIADAKKKMDEFAQANFDLGSKITPQLQEMEKEIRNLEQAADEFKEADLAKTFNEIQTNSLKASGSIADIGKEFTFLTEQTKVFLDSAGEGFKKVDAAMEGLGATADHVLEKQMADTKQWLSDIEDGWKRGEASLNDYTRSVNSSFTKQIELAQRLGKDTTEIEKAWDAANIAIVDAGGNLSILSVEAKKGTQELGFMAKQVSTVITDLSQGISDAILEGENFGEIFVNTFRSVGEAIIRYAVETMTDFLLTAIVDVEKATLQLGKAFDNVFGGLGDVLGGGGGKGLGAGLGGMKGLGGIAGGLTGLVGAIGAIGSMISGIIGNLQNVQMEKTLNAIEENTRYIKIWTGESEWSVRNNTGKTREGIGYVNASLDDIKVTLWEMRDLFKVAAAALVTGNEISEQKLQEVLDSMSKSVAAEVKTEEAVNKLGDKQEETTTATKSLSSTVNRTTSAVKSGSDDITQAVVEQINETRKLSRSIDDWGSVLSEVGYELNQVGIAVQKTATGISSMLGLGFGGFGGGGVTQTPSTPVEIKQLFYLRNLKMLDIPMSDITDALRGIYKEIKKAVKFADSSEEELRSIEKTTDHIENVTEDLNREQAQTTREITNSGDNITRGLTENTRATVQSGQSLGATMGAVSASFNTGMTGLGVTISKSMDSVSKTVAGAVTTVGQISSVYVPNASGINPPPPLLATTGGGQGKVSPGISKVNSSPADFVGINAQRIYGKKSIVLNVEYNNGDARTIANEMVGEWRRSGVDI